MSVSAGERAAARELRPALAHGRFPHPITAIDKRAWAGHNMGTGAGAAGDRAIVGLRPETSDPARQRGLGRYTFRALSAHCTAGWKSAKSPSGLSFHTQTCVYQY